MRTSELLKRYSIRLKKGLSQNFLSDERVARRIVEESGISSDDTVVEIGAGAGTLTEELAKTGAKVIAYEIDRSLKKLLEDRLTVYENVELHFEDFLKADLSWIEDGFKYVSNIPYGITGPILEKILREGRFSTAILMIQKEVAERLMAKPGRKSFGYISALVQTFCRVEKLFDVSRSHFVPNPGVDSTVVLLERSSVDLPFEDYRSFLSNVFSNRRKTLKNNLRRIVKNPEAIIKRMGLRSDVRAEQVGVEMLEAIFREVRG